MLRAERIPGSVSLQLLRDCALALSLLTNQPETRQKRKKMRKWKTHGKLQQGNK